MRTHGDGVTVGELFDRDFFNGSATLGPGETRVVNDPAATDINAVMFIAAAFRDQMGTEGGFRIGTTKRDVCRGICGCAACTLFTA
jgi:hypothetical protein